MNMKEDLRRELEEEYGIDAGSISTADDFDNLLNEDDEDGYPRNGSKKKKNKGN